MYKNIIILAFCFLSYSGIYGQVHITLYNIWGHNGINVSEATGSPYYSTANSNFTTQLVEWDRFYYKGSGQLLFSINDKFLMGGEFGFNRLYYWEERYRYTNIYTGGEYRFRYGTIWTMQIGMLANYYVAGNLYLQPGISFHNFMDKSGTTVGVSTAIGYDIPVAKHMSIPIEFRNDLIFGNATSKAFGGGLGVKFKLGVE